MTGHERPAPLGPTLAWSSHEDIVATAPPLGLWTCPRDERYTDFRFTSVQEVHGAAAYPIVCSASARTDVFPQKRRRAVFRGFQRQRAQLPRRPLSAPSHAMDGTQTR